MPGAINTKNKEDQPYIHGNEMRFSRDNESGNMLSIMENGQWQKAQTENLGTNLYHAEPSLSANGKKVWFVVGTPEGKLEFKTSKKNKDGNWSAAKDFKIVDTQ